MKRWILISLASIAFTSCGDGGGNPVDGPPGGGDGPGAVDADHHPDGVLPQGCGPGSLPGDTECSDCVDNDMDGHVDGFDVECTGAADDDEGSFATGIPGDNIDAVKQDCFFDGNSGSGNDGCEIHVCCLLGAPDQASCPIGSNQYDPTECADAMNDPDCIEFCTPLVPPGCDCFGCCTVCDPVTDVCRDIITNPNTAPDCDEDSILDPVACPSCVMSTACSNPCEQDGCILCPGQDPSDLPPSCGGINECPAGSQECLTQGCPGGSYCSNGCCIAVIE